jgi:ATP-dependent Clp protease protease subunit
MATLLLAAGTKGKRYALPNSRVMMHQPTGGATGQTSDISIAAREILRWRERMNGLIASHTNKTAEEIASDSDRDFYLTAQDALAYGIVDKVIEAKPID